MYEVRFVLPEDLPRVRNPLTGEESAPTNQDLMNAGLFRIGDTDYFDCVGAFDDRRGQYKDAAQLPGIRVAHGQDRYRNLPKPLRAELLQARVFRSTDPEVSLRHTVNKNDDPRRLRAGVPATGKGSERPIDMGKAMEALEGAKEIAAQGDAIMLNVPMHQVADGDVVEENLIPPMRFAGEQQPMRKRER